MAFCCVSFRWMSWRLFFKSVFFPGTFFEKIWFLKKSFDVSDATTSVDVDIDADVDDFVYFFVNSTRFFGNFWILFSVRFHSGKPSRIVGLTDAWTFVNWRFWQPLFHQAAISPDATPKGQKTKELKSFGLKLQKASIISYIKVSIPWIQM